VLRSRNIATGIILLFILSSVSVAHGIPSGGVYPPKFTAEDSYWGREWFDSWGYNRNNAEGSDGYLPAIAYESLGDYAEKAWRIGGQFKTEYSSITRRAEAILEYVQRWIEYGYDEDNVYMDGEAQAEWAWNADEMAHAFDETTLAVATGDCEDMAFLCTTLYLAAGFDVAVVSPPEHVALMIWLPSYSNANYYWDLNDGRGEGWIWVEPTGEDNPLGWTPPDFTDGDFEVYSIGASTGYLTVSNVYYSPQDPQAEDDVTVTASVSTQDSSISSVKLYYSIDGGSYKTLTMTLSSGSYKANIPGQADGTVVSFYVSATNAEGNDGQSIEYSYTVGGGGGGMEIPGFPFESILIGLSVGLAALYFLSRNKKVTWARSFNPSA